MGLYTHACMYHIAICVCVCDHSLNSLDVKIRDEKEGLILTNIFIAGFPLKYIHLHTHTYIYQFYNVTSL